MIPKIIHYCWFGGSSLPESVKKCLESWRKCCPDYKILQWNEDNYDISKNRYMEDAYHAGKWAFVSDYARIDIVNQYGGIYMDTDVELLKPLDTFLQDGLFAGWENRDPLFDQEKIPYENSVAFGLGFGAEKGHHVLKDLLDLYDKLSFYHEDGTINMTACPYYQTFILKKYGLDDTKRTLQKLNSIVIYPETYFSPKSQLTGKITITDDTVSIHHFSMSWVGNSERKYQRLRWKLTKQFGYSAAQKLVDIVSLPYRAKRKILK